MFRFATILFVWLLAGELFAGEATVVGRYLFDSSFDNFVQTFQKNEKTVWEETMKGATIESFKEGEIKLEFDLFTRIAKMTLKVVEKVDHETKAAVFGAQMVETNGVVKDQWTKVQVIGRNGKVYVTAKVHADVTEVPDELIRLHLNGAMKRMAIKVDSLLD